MILHYGLDSAERESRGDDSYRGEVWDYDPDVEPLEADSLADAARVADDAGKGVYFVEADGEVVGALCSIHGPTFGRRVWFYPHDGSDPVSAEML